MLRQERMAKIKIGISSCLLGERVRYDGGHKLDMYLVNTLGKYADWIPVCPEVEYGLSVPREAMRLVGDPASPRLVTVKTSRDHTDGMLKWAKEKLKKFKNDAISGFIFKGRSPSSGIRGVKVYTDSGVSSEKGTGIFAGEFIRYFPLIPVEDDGRLQNPPIRENFIERVCVFNRWQGLIGEKKSISALVDFHTDHKLLIMSHSPKHCAILGRLVAGAKKSSIFETYNEYITVLMEGLRLMATIKKNTNVLLHIFGYFKKNLSQEEKRELIEIIENYYKGLIPLIVPITLINHFVRLFDANYLKRQVYLNPHPLELMLRNHV